MLTENNHIDQFNRSAFKRCRKNVAKRSKNSIAKTAKTAKTRILHASLNP